MKCFWCQGGSGSVIADKIMGPIMKDIPPVYRPCARCAEQWDELAVVIEVTVDYNGMRPPIQKGYGDYAYYPTGRMVGLDPDFAPGLYAGSINIVPEETFENLFGETIRKRVQQDGRE